MNNNDNHNQNENNDGIGQQPRLLPRDDEDETQETDAENHLYELMGAADMTSATSLHSNLGENFPNPLGNLEFNGNEDQWRSTADILRDAQELDAAEVYQDVYRSVAAIDMNTQNRMGLEGTRFLDKEDTQSHYDASLQLQQQQVQPQLKPRIFDRIRLEHTHFYVSCPLTKFIDEMGIQFKVLKVDYMFDPQICVWRGMFFPAEPNEAVDFRVHMNSTKQDVVSPNNQLVEFVRRSGCTLAFNQLFARIRLALVDQKLVTKPDGTIVSSVLDLPPAYEEVEKLKQQLKSPSNNSNSSSSSSNNGQQLDGDLLPKPLLLSRSSSANSSVDDFDEDDDDDSMLGDIQCTDQELFHPLFNMAKSAFQDVHVQGLALIAREAKRGNGARMNNACNGLIELLIERLVSSSHPEVKRNCCTSLCEMARDQSLHDELLDKGAPAVLANVAATTYNPATLETQRQAAFALSNLCDNADALKAVFQAVESKIAVFEELAKCDDTRLTQAITNVRSALEAC